MELVNTVEEEDSYELLNPSKDQYFLFRCKGHIFALQALEVAEIVDIPKITKVPLMENFIEGVTNIRGQMVGVVDLRVLLGFETKKNDRYTSLAIARIYQHDTWHHIGIKIDEIYEVDGLDSSVFLEAPLFGSVIDAGFIKHLAKYNNKEVLVLDLQRVLDIQSLQKISHAKQDKNLSYSKPMRKSHLEAMQSDDSLEEEDEIDIIDLVGTNANDSNQYLVFHGPDKQLYAKNLAKVEEVIAYDELQVAKSYDDAIIVGTANIRGQMLTLISFDAWLGYADSKESIYEEVMILNYGGQNFGLLIRKTEQIVSILPDAMHDNSSANSKANFIASIVIDEKESLCTVIDSDQLMRDGFKLEQEQHERKISSLKSIKLKDKKVFFADDSRFIRSMIVRVAEQLNLDYSVFENGQLMLDEVLKTEPSSIGLIVTDVEMPVLDGKSFVQQIRANSLYSDIKILVHTNMASVVMEEELESAGADGLIAKVNIRALSEAIIKHMSV